MKCKGSLGYARSVEKGERRKRALKAKSVMRKREREKQRNISQR